MRTGEIHPQAEKLNTSLEQNCAIAFRLLSQKGKAIFYPKDGIPLQSLEAKDTEINATIGIALDDSGSALTTKSLAQFLPNHDPNMVRYAGGFGVMELREVWKKEIERKNPSIAGKKMTLPVVVGGLTHGLSIAGYLFCDENDEIISPDKYWGNYRLIFENNYGAKIRTFPLFTKNKWNTKGLKEALEAGGRGKKIVLLNFPNNPTGYTPNSEEQSKIIEILKDCADKGSDILVICDDAYFGLFYESNTPTESIFSAVAEAHPRILAVKIDGATKEEYAWGLRVAFITMRTQDLNEKSAQALEEKTAGAIRSQISNVSCPGQKSILNALQNPEYLSEKQKNFELLRERYRMIQEILNKNVVRYSEFFYPLPFNSGYFLCLELKEKINAEEVRQILLKNFSTGVIATGNLIRIAFSAIAAEKVEPLIENIFSACQAVANEQ